RMLLQTRLQLRLSDQKDVQEFILRRLEVRQEPHLLENLIGEAMGFVENDDDTSVCLKLINEEHLQSTGGSENRFMRRKLELRQEMRVQVLSIEARIEE